MVPKEPQTTEEKLEAANRELEVMKERLNFNDKRRHETWKASGSRRLSACPMNDRTKLDTVLDKVENEVKDIIPEEVIDTLTDLKGKPITRGMDLICLEFNNNQCDKNYLHQLFRTNKMKMHACVICMRLLKVF